MNFIPDTHFDADVLIVGGGPAGAAAAFHLAKAGFQVILLDFQRFPRDKVCGDFVGPVAIRELEALGITAHAAFRQTNPIRQATVYLDGDPLITKQIPRIKDYPHSGHVIPRLIFDQWLLEAAVQQGVKVITPCRLQHFESYDNCVLSYCRQGSKELSFTTKFLIGADGSSSTTSRIVNGSKPDPKDRIVAVRAYYEGIRCVPEQAELYFTSKSFPGYYWLFPTGPDTANIGVGMVLDNFPREDINLKELLLDLIASDKTLKEKIGDGVIQGKVMGWPLSTYNPDARIAMHRVLLAGDAAGLINSLNGEGIQYAMLSGRWAAEALIAHASPAEAVKHYEATVREQVGYDMCLSNMIIQFIRNRHFNPLWLSLLGMMSERAVKDDAYADIAGGILAGLVPANEAMSLSFIGKSVLQGVSSALHASMDIAKQGPVGISAFGLRAAGFALSQLSGVLQQPGDYWRWTKGLARNGMHLSGYVLKDVKGQIGLNARSGGLTNLDTRVDHS